MRDYSATSVAWFIECLITLFTTTICTLYIYSKVRSVLSRKRKTVLLGICCIILSSAAVVLNIDSNIYIKTLYIILLCVLLFLFDDFKGFSCIPIAIIALSFSYCIEYISVLIVCSGFYVVGYTRDNIIVALCTSAMQMLVTIGLMKIKRIKSLFTVLSKEKNYGIGLLISSYVLVFCVLLSTKTDYLGSDISAIVFIGVPLAFTGIILWIGHIIKTYYKQRLVDRANEHTLQEIEDKDNRIERLEAEVATLAKQLHRDNHLMSSLDRSVQSLAECETEEQREQIIGEIQTMCRERNELVAKEQQQNMILPSTGIALIDSSLSDLYVKAAAHGIGFDLTVNEELHYLVNNIISQTDLQTLLCDHIKDAIIAVKSAGITDGRILVTIAKNDGIFEIAIRDNGVDFEVDTLAKLGREQVTTHADDGGSGIGFLTTFETLQKTKGSLIITEYEQKTPFSKSVAFVFDGLNRFVISTYQKDEFKNVVQRDDVTIMG